MLGYVAIVHILFFLNILIEGKERPAKTKLFPAKLCAVLDTFGSAVNFDCWLRAVLYCAESDSAQYHTARSRTQVFENKYKNIWIGPVSHCA